MLLLQLYSNKVNNKIHFHGSFMKAIRHISRKKKKDEFACYGCFLAADNGMSWPLSCAHFLASLISQGDSLLW